MPSGLRINNKIYFWLSNWEVFPSSKLPQKRQAASPIKKVYITKARESSPFSFMGSRPVQRTRVVNHRLAVIRANILHGGRTV